MQQAWIHCPNCHSDIWVFVVVQPGFSSDNAIHIQILEKQCPICSVYLHCKTIAKLEMEIEKQVHK